MITWSWWKMLSINIYVILISNHSEIYEIYLELISRIVSPSSFCRMFRLYIFLESHSYETLCCNIYIYIYIRNSRYAIISKSLVEEWTIEVEKIVDKKISRDKLARVVTTGSMKSFVKYCRFLIARHWRIARNVWKLLDEFERASFLYVRKTRVSSLHRLINFKKLIANVRQYLYRQISLLREITR